VDPASSLIIAFIFFIYEFLVTMDAYGPKFVIGILPIMSGFFAGILIGNIPLGVAIAAATQLIALGAVPMGGAVPPDFGIVAITAVVLASIGGIDPMIAIVFSLPAGILGMYLDIIGRTVNITLVHRVEGLIAEGRIDDIDKWHYLGMPIMGFFRGLAVFISVFIAAYWGGEALKSFLESLPSWFLNGLSVAGAVLPAMGLGLLLTYLGLKRYLIIFLIAFILVAFLNIPFIFALVVLIGFAVLWFKSKSALKMERGETTVGVEIPKDVLNSSKLRTVFFFEASWNYELMQGLGYLYSILPILKHIYSGEELKEAVRNHLEFFNTNPILAPMVVSLDAVIESSRKGDFDFVRNLKVGLMGPLAGLGDSVIYLAVAGVLIITSISLINQGIWLAPLLFIGLFDVVTFLLRFKTYDFGYKRGLNIASVLTEERMKTIREFAEKLAILSIGAIIPIVFQIRPAIGVEILSSIDQTLVIFSITLLISSITGLLLTLLAQTLYQRKFKLYHVLLILFVLGFILGASGLFGVIGYVAPSS